MRFWLLNQWSQPTTHTFVKRNELQHTEQLYNNCNDVIHRKGIGPSGIDKPQYTQHGRQKTKNAVYTLMETLPHGHDKTARQQQREGDVNCCPTRKQKEEQRHQFENIRKELTTQRVYNRRSGTLGCHINQRTCTRTWRQAKSHKRDIKYTYTQKNGGKAANQHKMEEALAKAGCPVKVHCNLGCELSISVNFMFQGAHKLSHHVTELAQRQGCKLVPGGSNGFGSASAETVFPQQQRLLHPKSPTPCAQVTAIPPQRGSSG